MLLWPMWNMSSSYEVKCACVYPSEIRRSLRVNSPFIESTPHDTSNCAIVWISPCTRWTIPAQHPLGPVQSMAYCSYHRVPVIVCQFRKIMMAEGKIALNVFKHWEQDLKNKYPLLELWDGFSTPVLYFCSVLLSATLCWATFLSGSAADCRFVF